LCWAINLYILLFLYEVRVQIKATVFRRFSNYF